MTDRSTRASGATQPKPVLLVVEDDLVLRIMIGEILRAAFPGCNCISCGSGEEAVRLARAEKIDAILMDIGLPGINGIQTTGQIKEIAPRVPVVMLTGYGVDMFGPMAKAAGAAAYVVKDAMCKDLVPLLDRLLAGQDEMTSVRAAASASISRRSHSR